MIHELRIYTLRPGKMAEYQNAARTIGRPVRGNDYGVNHGYWTTEFGALNQIWHIWSYDSLDERTRLRAALAKNERWTKEYTPVIRPLIERQDIRLLNPVKPITPPANAGNVFEMRIYRGGVGAARQWADAYMKILPVREKYSKNVGIWLGEAPQPNEVLHMWNYSSVEERMKARGELFKDPEWQAFLTSVAGLIVEQQNFLLLPTDYSAMK